MELVPADERPHYGQWVIWGEYDQPVRLAQSVHNLEHGGIVIFYGPRCRRTRSRSCARSTARPGRDAARAAAAPRGQDRGHRLVLADDRRAHNSQGILAECTSFDEDAFRAFRDAYRYKGPERIPPESLQPGT